jgi:hypothetical protein
MKNLKPLTITVTIAWSCLAGFPYNSQAQLPLPIVQADNSSNVDDLPDNSQQMRTWQCTQGNQEVAVEAKDVSFWKEVIEGTQWQCSEADIDIPDGNITFSCEPDDIIGILTVVWLRGEGARTQMLTWLNDLNTNYDLICTKGKTSADW